MFSVAPECEFRRIFFCAPAAAFGSPTQQSLAGIVQPPVSRVVLLGGATNFSVVASASRAIQFQWRLNGVPLPGATSPTLVLTNIQPTNEGITPWSSRMLTIVFKPVWTLQPIGQTAVEGRPVSFSVAATGTPPIHFRWRTNGFTFTDALIVNTPTNSSLIVPSVTTNFDGMRFDVAPTNVAGAGTLSARVYLTVLRDADGDGLPDTWEQSRPGFNPNDPSDALRDDDGDGANNRAEYFAGTDYLDASSFLKVELSVAGGATIQFMAVSNRTYTIQYSDSLPGGWTKLADVLATTSNRVESIRDPAASARRFYRLVTPVAP